MNITEGAIDKYDREINRGCNQQMQLREKYKQTRSQWAR